MNIRMRKFLNTLSDTQVIVDHDYCIVTFDKVSECGNSST